jgi:hypothetical protein
MKKLRIAKPNINKLFKAPNKSKYLYLKQALGMKEINKKEFDQLSQSIPTEYRTIFNRNKSHEQHVSNKLDR